MSLAKIIGRLWGNRVGNRLVEEIVADIKVGRDLESKPDLQSGTLEIVEKNLRYSSTDYASWDVPLHDIKVIGEYTTNNGPHIDDWFLVFVTGDDQWVEASNYGTASDALRKALGERFGVDALWGGLAYTTDFDSKVLAPSHLADQPLFEFREVPQSIWTTIVRLGCKTVVKNLTPPVLEHIKSLV